MRIEFVDEADDWEPAPVFPQEDDYQDLRENPRAVGRIPAARRYMPLRNFLTAVNGADSIFITASASTKSDSPAAISAGSAYEFASQVTFVFAELSVNFERERFASLRSGLKDLLERDSGDMVRATLRIAPCKFSAQNRRGFCLGIRLVAQGESAEQAELRWGLALARLQQALLFRSRALQQQIDG